jgi:isopenicillin N synthase-like dioxygenase
MHWTSLTHMGTCGIVLDMTDNTSGLEFEDPSSDDTWIQVSSYATVVLAGWCAVVLTGARVVAARYRVRRTPGVRKLNAVLFLVPYPEILSSLLVEMLNPEKPFSKCVEDGMLTIG